MSRICNDFDVPVRGGMELLTCLSHGYTIGKLCMSNPGVDMESDKRLCIICAWRENCLKKFRFSDGVALHCVDFCQDLTIKDQKEAIEGEGEVEVE